MANSSNSPNAKQAMNLQEVTQCLERELRLRTIETATNATGPMLCTPPPPGSLLQRLAGCCKNTTSPRTVNPSPFGRGSSRGLSPSPSASSDSSLSGGVSVFRFPESMERTKLATLSSINSTPNAAPARPIYAARGTRLTVVSQSAGVQQMQNSQLPSSSTGGRGKNGSSTAVSIGGPPAKVIKKRTRPSKKPLTRIVPTTVERFRATVQELTGCKVPPVVRPQPERPQASAAVPINDTDSRNLPASPPSSMVSSVCNPSPTASDRVPEASFPTRDSSPSSSKSSSMNHCFGYSDSATPPFLFVDERNYDENLGQLPGESLRPASDSVHRYPSEPTQYKSREVRTSAATPTGSSAEEAALLPSEGTRRTGIPRERSGLGSNIHDSGFGSSMPDQITRPSPLVEPRHRPMEPDSLGMESENWDDCGFDFMMDWLNFQ